MVRITNKFITGIAAALCFASFSPAQNILSNGDMEYGDGGWYLWNKPEGPAQVETQIGVKGFGTNGSQGAKIVIKKPPQIWWGLQLQPPKFLADSAYYTLSFAAKGNITITSVVQGGAPDYRQKESGSFKLTPEWKTYTMPFLADQKGFGLNNVAFQIGYTTGWVQLDDVQITPMENLDESWYAGAGARIDSLRKTDFTVKANPGEKVSVELIRHAFPFGTALALYDSKDSSELKYRAEAKKLFWAGVPENQFKWPEYEPKKGKLNRDALKEYTDFAKDNGWLLRGHALVWAIQGYNYDKHFSNKGSCAEIAANIKNRITRDVSEYKGKFAEYDVWNEPMHEQFLFNKCGWSLMDSAFVWAHRADSTATLYINEYNVVAAGETDRFIEIVKGMLDRKIPVSGIGVQCHYQARPVSPAMIKFRLDKLAALGLPIKVTEFDIGTVDRGLGVTEEKQAEEFTKFITAAFSHPAVKGIMLWGFQDGRHWIADGGIVAADGREKPAAIAVYKLWHETWTTKETAIADNAGFAHFRGFKGKYRVTINGKASEITTK